MWTTLLPLLAAASSDPTVALGFDDVLNLSEDHPQLQAADAALRARAARDADISTLSNNPTVQVLPGWRLPGASDPGFEIQASVSQSIDLGGVGGAARRAARAERATLAVDRRAEALSVRIDAAQAWIELWAAQETLAATRRERDIARELATAIARAVALGAELRPNALEAQLFADNLDAAVIDVEGQVYERSLALAASLGRPGLPVPAAEGGLPPVELPNSETWSRWIGRAAELPAAEAARMREHAAAARVAEAKASASTRIVPTVTAQWERPHDALVFAGLGVQLPWFDVNARARSLAEADVAAARITAARADTAAERLLRLALHEVEHSREISAQLARQTIPTARAWVDAAQQAFEAGESDVFPVLRARRQLAAARIDAVRADARQAWSEVKAWLLLASLPREGATS